VAFRTRALETDIVDRDHEDEEHPTLNDGIASGPRVMTFRDQRTDRIHVSLCCSQAKRIELIYSRCFPHEGRPIDPDDKSAVFHHEIFAERGFTSEDAADSWLQQSATWPLFMILSDIRNEDQGWRGPVPILGRSVKARNAFTGPYLKNTEAPKTLSADDLLNAELRDILGEENFNTASAAAEGLGLSFPLSPDQQRTVCRYSERLRIPTIECRLADDWGFRKVLADVRSQAYHSLVIATNSLLEHLRYACIELETALFRVLSDVSAADVYNFWTSLQLREHLKLLATRLSGLIYRGDDMHLALGIVGRWVGVYSVQFRPPVMRDVMAGEENIAATGNGTEIGAWSSTTRALATAPAWSAPEALSFREVTELPDQITLPKQDEVIHEITVDKSVSKDPANAPGSFDGVPAWAAHLETPEGRKAAREGWKQQWTTSERRCTNNDLTHTAFSQSDFAFLNQWENGKTRLKEPDRSGRVQAIERVLRNNIPPRWHPANKQNAS
jgi:hypothetical protein